MSRSAKLLRSFVRSSSYVQRVSEVAKRQLNAIAMFKKDWESVHGCDFMLIQSFLWRGRGVFVAAFDKLTDVNFEEVGDGAYY